MRCTCLVPTTTTDRRRGNKKMRKWEITFGPSRARWSTGDCIRWGKKFSYKKYSIRQWKTAVHECRRSISLTPLDSLAVDEAFWRVFHMRARSTGPSRRVLLKIYVKRGERERMRFVIRTLIQAFSYWGSFRGFFFAFASSVSVQQDLLDCVARGPSHLSVTLLCTSTHAVFESVISRAAITTLPNVVDRTILFWLHYIKRDFKRCWASKKERRFLLQHAMFRFMVESVTEKNYQSIDRGKAERQRRDMCWETLSQTTAQTSYNLYKLLRSSSVLYFIFSVVEVSVRTENCCVFLSFQRFTHMRVVHGLMAFFFGGFFLHSSSLHRGWGLRVVGWLARSWRTLACTGQEHFMLILSILLFSHARNIDIRTWTISMIAQFFYP